MKKLKIIISLLLVTAFIMSCEKENSEINLQENKSEIKSFTNMLEMIGSGIDMQDNIAVKQTTSQRENVFCANLPIEDFEQANVDDFGAIGIFGTLDEYTDNHVFSEGDIQEGVIFSSRNQNMLVVLGAGLLGNSSVILGADMFADDLIIEFTNNNVTNVGMDVIIGVGGDGEIQIEIFGTTGSIEVVDFFATFEGTYFEYTSEEPIVRIEILAGGKGELIDNLTFGSCDMDGDGVLDEDDPYPNSNMSEYISVGEITLDIENIFVATGTTMMDQIDNLVDQINTSYYGDYGKGNSEEDNWDELHEAFNTKLAHITYYWRINKLVTAGDRAEISSEAWGADIPYMDVD